MYNVFGFDMTYSKTYTLQPGLICNIFKIQFKILKSDISVLIKSIRQFFLQDRSCFVAQRSVQS